MKVAICIASYNRAEFLPELLDSIQAQTFTDYHIYLGYDGSTDDSAEVIADYMKGFGQAIPITVLGYKDVARIGLNKHDVVARALKDGPDLIQMIDSDDKIEPTFLEKSVNLIGEHDWLLSWGKQFGSREGNIEGYITPLDELRHRNRLHSWGMFKAHVLRKYNYNSELEFGEDWNLWLRLAVAGYEGVILEEHLYLQRWHDNNLNKTYKYNYANMRSTVLSGLKLSEVDRPYRFHLLGLVHLPVSETYMACAFTQKIAKMSKMLLSLGHEVFLYGAEGSDAPCTKFFQTHSLADIRREWGSGDNRFDIGYNWKEQEFRHDFNKDRTETTKRYYETAAIAINGNKYLDDFLLLFQGQYQQPVANRTGLYLTVEPGIGYRGSLNTSLPFSEGPFRAFESAYLQNFTYGSYEPFKGVNGRYYDRVIPNYFEPKDFPYQAKKGDYFFYIGRMINRKGLWTAINTTRRIGAPLIIAGQEDSEIPVNKLPPHCKFVGYVGPKERAELMGGARGVFVPTKYLEAFGGTNVEAQLCGTPVITTNFGVFPETVIHGVTGFRCNTLAQFVEAARNVDKLQPKKIRAHAERYLTTNVRWEFQEWFDDLYQLFLSKVDPKWRGQGWSYVP